MEYLAEAELIWLTPNRSPPSTAPVSIYDQTKDQSYFDQCFWPIGKLGEGSFGKVLMVLEKCDKGIYALKVSKEPYKNFSERWRRMKELQIQKMFYKHPNIITLYDAWEEDRLIFMKMELGKGNLVLSEPVSESECWNILTDIAMALHFIHELGVGHFDVKLENIQKGYDGLYKLCDFGLAHKFEKDDMSMPEEGDAKYLAPELLSQSSEISTKADIFSLGIAILELAGNLSLPSNGKVWQALRDNTFPFQETAHLTDELFSLLTKMMDPNPSQRPSAKDILNMPIVQTVMEKRMVLSEVFAQPLLLLESELALYMAVWSMLFAYLIILRKLKKDIGIHVSEPMDTSEPFESFKENKMKNSSTLVDSLKRNSSYLSRPFESPSSEGMGFLDSPGTSNSSSSSVVTDQGFKLPKPLQRTPLAPLPSSTTNYFCFSAPSALRLAISPNHMSNEEKEKIRARKRKRLSDVEPRDLMKMFGD